MLVKQFGALEQMSLEDLPTPVPGQGEVLIDARAIGVNFPDLLVIEGTYQILPELPFSPGKEVAGVVRAVGPGVASPNVGERVTAQVEHGAYREQVLAEANNVAVLPESVGYEAGAAFGLGYLTVYFGLLRRARLEPGEWVLVTGASGGVGSAGVQLAKALGARVIAVGRTEDKRNFALEQGADHTIEFKPEGFKERVMELTDGHGADVILESVGGELFRACMRAIAWEGRLVIIGFAAGEIPTVKAGHVLVKNMDLIGVQSSDYREREPESFREAQEELLGLLTHGKIGVQVTATYPLEAAAEALEEIRDSRVLGKVVLTTGASA
ncbi:MAG TPA: NADPH:quinone oxidoreductase family protein [Rubrobacter sp.]|jgi:NADPH:quinone reductase|nr:NADPH:quinone oxidoreductase family protein [Rubrobacter sp.]